MRQRVLFGIVGLSTLVLAACSATTPPGATAPAGNGGFYSGVPDNEEAWRTALESSLARLERVTNLVTGDGHNAAQRSIMPTVLCPCAPNQILLAAPPAAPPVCRVMNGYHCGLVNQPAAVFTAVARALRTSGWIASSAEPTEATPTLRVRGIEFELRSGLEAPDYHGNPRSVALRGRMENGVPHIAIDEARFRQMIVEGAVPFCLAPEQDGVQDALVVHLFDQLMGLVFGTEDFHSIYASPLTETNHCAAGASRVDFPFLGTSFRACRSGIGLKDGALVVSGCDALAL